MLVEVVGDLRKFQLPEVVGDKLPLLLREGQLVPPDIPLLPLVVIVVVPLQGFQEEEMSDTPKTEVVKCPEPFAPLFAEAEKIMGSFFSDLKRVPEQGDIQISGVRYLMMRTDSLAIELHEELRKTFGEAGARQIRYKIARACGMRDAKMFHERLGIDDPTMKLALGPVHFAHVGWANVDIFPESAPQPNEDYFLVYDHRGFHVRLYPLSFR